MVNEFGWVYEPQPEHKCSTPSLRGHYEGSLWRCKACGQFWEAVHHQGVGLMLETVSEDAAMVRIKLAGSSG